MGFSVQSGGTDRTARDARLLGLLTGAGLSLLAHAAQAEQNFPPPEFTQPYEFPALLSPPARPEFLGYVDAAVLLITLLFAAWFAHRSRSRTHLMVLVFFSVLYFGFYRKGCVCAVGAIQNVALAVASPEYALALTVAVFFVLPLLAALFWGRVFCSSVCPLGAAQELVLLRPLRVPAWLGNPLTLVPWAYLGAGVLFAATGSAFIICRYDPIVPFFRFAGVEFMVVTGVVIMLLATVVGRPYCRYLCPYGTLLGMLSRLSAKRAVITTQDCINCHLCARACPYGAILPPTAPAGTVPRTEGRTRLAVMVLLLPLLIAACGWLANLNCDNLARVDQRVRLAETLWAWEQKPGDVEPDEIRAFVHSGRPSTDVYAEAALVRGRFQLGSWLFGGWVGLMIGLRLIGLSVRRHRTHYEIDQSACVLCGRCYDVCPLDRADAKTPVPGQMEGPQ